MPAIAPRPDNVRQMFPSPPTNEKRSGMTCAKCNLRETCLSSGVPAEHLGHAEKIVYARTRIRRGTALYRAGESSQCIYAVRSGFFKSTITDRDGREQVTGFFMSGELLGMDGLARGVCESSAIALEDSDVCSMPYALIEQIGRDIPSLQRRLNAALAREIQRDHGVMLLLGCMCAEERLASFLLNLSGRFLRRGYSGSQFVLRMTRNDIGSFLGLQLETVSRLFSAFHKIGLITVQQRQVSIIDVKGLELVLASRH
jgi:CRP/FNR family transcriptional regulator